MMQRWIASAVSVSILWTTLLVALFEHRISKSRDESLNEIIALQGQLAEMKLTKGNSGSTYATPDVTHPAHSKEMGEMKLAHTDLKEQVAEMKMAQAADMTSHDMHKNERKLGGFF
jgi:hypothetical protein